MMRDSFAEFNRPTMKGFKKLWTEAIFVFDTNVLLSLYGMPLQAREKMISVLKQLEKQDRIWIPHQVAMEFYRRRTDVIYNQEKQHNEALNLLEKTRLNISQRFDSKIILKKIAQCSNTIKFEIEKSKKSVCNWLKKDKIETELNKIFKNKVGQSYTEIRLSEIYKVGQDRYDKDIPPGYEDKNKDKDDKTHTRKFGDLIMWFQIIDQAKSTKKPIIFITDEQKPDWWWKINETKIGPRHELRKEIKDVASVNFYMYQSEHFMKHAGEYLKIKFNKDLIEQVREFKKTGMEDDDLVSCQETLSVSSADNIGIGENIKAVIDPVSSENSLGSTKNPDMKKVSDKQAEQGTK